jgi:phosphoglycolate phosphatase-like HAD superfamily hydrolase
MLIFDFDGVLMDSVREIAVTAYNTLQGTIITKLNQIPKAALALFLRNRFHVQPIGDTQVLMKWCLETGASDPKKLLSPEEYDLLIQEVAEPIVQRTNRFFEMRGRFKQKDINAWLELNAPVQPLWRLLIAMQRENLVILTNKNREATMDLCSHFGLPISNDNIYSGDNGITKIDNMLRIMQRFRAFPYNFIDDSIKNLCEIDAYFNRDQKMIDLIFAPWGYTGPDDAGCARKFGYQVLTMDDFINAMKRNIF